MSVVLSMEEVGPCRQRLEIEVPKPAADAESQRVVAEYRRKARLPGFRQGKAPAELVKRRFGQEIRQEVIDRLVPRYWHQAEAEKELELLLPPALEEVTFELGEGMKFIAVVETRPDIELGDLDSFELPEMAVTVDGEEIEEQLEELRRRAGTWSPVDRPAARGDQVLAEITRGDEESRKAMIEVGDERVWEELTLAVTGLKAGQESHFDHEEGEEKHAYAVKVEEVRELELAELDDELAQRVTGLESLPELREQIGKSIEGAKTQDRRRRREQALLEQLREAHPLEVPSGVVEQELEVMVRDYAHTLAHQGVDLEQAEIDWGAIAEQLRPEAVKAVHSRLIVDAVAAERGIEVPEERLEAMLAEIGRARKTSPLAVRRELDSSGRLASLRGQLRREATIASLLGEPLEGVESAAEEVEESGSAETTESEGGD